VTAAVRSLVPRRSPPSRPVRERQRHLRVVDPAALRRERWRRIGVRAAVFATAAAVLGVVVVHATMAEREVRLDDVAAGTQRAQRRYELLRLEYAQQSSPQAVIDRATRLGMVPAPSPRYLSAPGAVEEGTPPNGSTTAASMEEDWGKVKPNLVAAP